MKNMSTAALARHEALGELQPMRPAGSYTFDELYRMAQVFHASGLYEDVKDAAQAMVKIIKGQELGIPPTTAMSCFDIIQRRLFIKPWAIAAKINSCGYGAYRITEQTAERCAIVFLRRYSGAGWVECPPVSYTYAEAQAHGLVSRSAHWKANPAHMLYQRALGRGGAMYFPELLAGLELLSPDPEELPSAAEAQQAVIDLFGERRRDSTAPPIETAAAALINPRWRQTLVDLRAYATGELGEAVTTALEDPAYDPDTGERLAQALADVAASAEEGTA